MKKYDIRFIYFMPSSPANNQQLLFPSWPHKLKHEVMAMSLGSAVII